MDWHDLSPRLREVTESRTGPVRSGRAISAGKNSAVALLLDTPDDRLILHLVHDNGAELVVGFRGDRGVCLWQVDDGAVTTGGGNDEVVLYPPGPPAGTDPPLPLGPRAGSPRQSP